MMPLQRRVPLLYVQEGVGLPCFLIAFHMLQVMNGVAPADMPQAEEFLSNINLSLRKSLIAIDLK